MKFIACHAYLCNFPHAISTSQRTNERMAEYKRALLGRRSNDTPARTDWLVVCAQDCARFAWYILTGTQPAGKQYWYCLWVRQQEVPWTAAAAAVVSWMETIHRIGFFFTASFDDVSHAMNSHSSVPVSLVFVPRSRSKQLQCSHHHGAVYTRTNLFL